MRYSSYIVTALALAGSALARPDGVGGHHDHGGHHADHGAAAAPAPATGYQEPVSGYDAGLQADPGYSAPASGYGQPASGYGQPSSGYEQPQSGYGDYGATGFAETAPAEAGGLDLSTLLIPILIIAGLALLFPSVTSVAVRKRRDVGDESPMSNMVERVQDMYMAVLQSEECLERVACEVGGLAEDAEIGRAHV